MKDLQYDTRLPTVVILCWWISQNNLIEWLFRSNILIPRIAVAHSNRFLKNKEWWNLNLGQSEWRDMFGSLKILCTTRTYKEKLNSHNFYNRFLYKEYNIVELCRMKSAINIMRLIRRDIPSAWSFCFSTVFKFSNFYQLLNQKNFIIGQFAQFTLFAIYSILISRSLKINHLCMFNNQAFIFHKERFEIASQDKERT